MNSAGAKLAGVNAHTQWLRYRLNGGLIGLRTIRVFSISAISLRQEYSRSQAQMHISLLASVHQVR